ncbi:ATP-binding cassette domain-containing protein [Patescibacteria group bacterium]|nr:ATP-binding cassette domain-containing protein [Patescibacteria group bacterium]
MLKITNLKKYFGGVKAVDGCDFEVKKNTITALIGPNGSGKSTVFNLVSGILKADKGSIYFTKTLGFASKHKNTKLNLATEKWKAILNRRLVVYWKSRSVGYRSYGER